MQNLKEILDENTFHFEYIYDIYPKTIQYLIDHSPEEPLVCSRCGGVVIKSDVEGYSWQCMHCDEDMYFFEVEKRELDSLSVLNLISNTVDYLLLDEKKDFVRSFIELLRELDKYNDLDELMESPLFTENFEGDYVDVSYDDIIVTVGTDLLPNSFIEVWDRSGYSYEQLDIREYLPKFMLDKYGFICYNNTVKEVLNKCWNL
jgi:hypothetical protein